MKYYSGRVNGSKFIYTQYTIISRRNNLKNDIVGNLLYVVLFVLDQ